MTVAANLGKPAGAVHPKTLKEGRFVSEHKLLILINELFKQGTMQLPLQSMGNCHSHTCDFSQADEKRVIKGIPLN